jgi:DNA invertase Pin-like site-specific DNA recombinase
MSTLGSSVGSYTRTSGERSTRQKLLESQLEDLRARAHADGVELLPELILIDDGYGGAELRRPALKRLRELAATGALHRLYVPCPDRLARVFADQILLTDELHRGGVEVVFLGLNQGHVDLARRAST